jgi:hypothetical protein
VDNALEISVHNATEEFDSAPHDVYNGILELLWARNRKAVALENLDYFELRSVTRTFSVDRWLVRGFSHDGLVVHPCPSTSPVSLDDWTIDVKSIQVVRDVVELMRLQGDEHSWEMYGLFHDNPESVTVAG